MDSQPDLRSELPWYRPDWLATAIEWIDRQVALLGFEVSAPVEQPHAYWWSTVLRVPTTGGVLWFKASQPDGRFEVRLTQLLADEWPSRSAEILATDLERGWTLARDAGTRLREIGGSVPVVDHWAELLPSYAEVQIKLARRRVELLALGVPDLRLDALPRELGAALADPELLLLDHPAGLTAVDLAQLRRRLPEFSTLCGRLAGYGIPETLQHDDLHDGNVFVRAGGYVFFDWGDACITHPFHTLAVTLRALSYRNGWAPGGTEVLRLRDSYLEAWSGYGSRDELQAAAALALQTGTIQRALRWRQGLLEMPPVVRAEYVDSVPYGLRLFLQSGPFGTWDDGSF